MLPSVADPDTGRVDPRRLIGGARLAEAGGFDGVYVGDHLLHPHPILESLTSLAAVATSTERVQIGPCVLLIALREPLFLAKQIATLAALAPGRLRIGIGVGGEYPGEFAAARVPLGERGRRTDRALSELRSLLSEGLETQGVVLAPRAAAVPFFGGGRSERALARAASTQGWVGYLLGPESFARRRARLVELNPDPSFATGMLIPCHVEDSTGAAAAAARAWSRLTGHGEAMPERLFAAGSPNAAADQLHRYWELGCRDFVLGVAEQGNRYPEQVERLAAEVLPVIRQFD